MNIIAGKARGRRLKTLAGEATRPTSAKVRAALFNILMAYVPDADWLDLFAGSGAIGLEAASRGARRVVLVELAQPAVAVIRENLALTQLPGVELIAADVATAIGRLAGQRFDVVFMDPPYKDDPVAAAEALERAELLVADGRVVIEHRADRTLPEAIGRLEKVRTSCYADSCLSFYRWAPSAE